MNGKYLTLLAGLLTIGILGASGSNGSATIETSIANKNAAEIEQIADINDIQHISIGDGIAEQNAIDTAISADESSISINDSEISEISRIAEIQDRQINAEIAEIAA
jgi:hypothetical protein